MRNKTILYFILCMAIGWSCKPKEESGDGTTTEVAEDSLGGVVRLTLPEGFASTVVVDSLGAAARHLAVRENGDIYVKMARVKSRKGIVALRDENGDGRADVIESFGAYAGTGLAIHNGFLYASSDTEVFRYKLQDGALLPDTTSVETIVTGLVKQREHPTKSIALDPQGHLYVNMGAPSNACQEENRVKGSAGLDPCPLLELNGGIWQFDANKPGQLQQNGIRYCTGIRNCVALDWNTATNGLFALQHGRDQLAMLAPEYFNDEQSAELPSEEFLQIDKGDDFGWPYCYYDHLQGKKVLAPEYGGDGKKTGRCEGKKDPILGFPGHLAPNDLLFYTGDQFPARYKNGAFIAFHGSWNRAPLPQKGFFVVFVPFENGKPAGEWEIFADGFSGLDIVVGPGDAAHRPTGLAQGPDGALYVSDTMKGRIWKISYKGGNTH